MLQDVWRNQGLNKRGSRVHHAWVWGRPNHIKSIVNTLTNHYCESEFPWLELVTLWSHNDNIYKNRMSNKSKTKLLVLVWASYDMDILNFVLQEDRGRKFILIKQWKKFPCRRRCRKKLSVSQVQVVSSATHTTAQRVLHTCNGLLI